MKCSTKHPTKRHVVSCANLATGRTERRPLLTGRYKHSLYHLYIAAVYTLSIYMPVHFPRWAFKVAECRCLCSFICSLHFSSISSSPPPAPSFALLLHMFVSVGLSRPVNLSASSDDRALCVCVCVSFLLALSSPFLSFFTPPSLVSAHRHTHTHVHPISLAHTHTTTYKTKASTNSFSHTPSQVHPPAVSLSLSHSHSRTHSAHRAKSTLLHKGWCSNVLTRMSGHKTKSVCLTK